MSIQNIAPIPKGWERVTEHCYVDKKGKPHLLTKVTYSTALPVRKYSLKYAAQHRDAANQTSKVWKKKFPEKVHTHRVISNEQYYDCVKEVKKLRSRNQRVELRIVKGKSKSSACVEYHHERCVGKKRSCSCRCHKGGVSP